MIPSIRLKSLLCGVCLFWNAVLIQSSSSWSFASVQEHAPDGYEESSKHSRFVPFQDKKCIALVIEKNVPDGVRFELMCSPENGLSYRIPSIDTKWITKMTISGDLISGKTIMTLPPDTNLNLHTHEISMTGLPNLSLEQPSQDHRRLATTPMPSTQPSTQPSSMPSTQPSSMPSTQPSKQPSSMPSKQPSKQPSSMPSKQPSRAPSKNPSSTPSRLPSVAPSIKPSIQPSAGPSIMPSTIPSTVPSQEPSSKPSKSNAPSTSMQPSSRPSGSSKPSLSFAPSMQPSRAPSVSPSSRPSGLASSSPSSRPSVVPSMQPSTRPSTMPSAGPSSVPSIAPSKSPSKSFSPSANPSSSDRPSVAPSSMPSRVPSVAPSHLPTIPGASARPSGVASFSPSRHSSITPSVSMQPSKSPSTSSAPSSNSGNNNIFGTTPRPTNITPIQRIATIVVEIGIGAGLNDNLDSICNGFGGFLSQGIQDAYGASSTSNVVCTQGLRRRRQRRNLQTTFDLEKPIMITVTTTFSDFTKAPRQFGFVDFLEQLIISDRAQKDLPGYIQQAVAGTNIDGAVHVTLVYSAGTTGNKPVLIVAFGDDAPTASPTVSKAADGNTPVPASTSSSGSCSIPYLLSSLLCSAFAGISMMDIILF